MAHRSYLFVPADSERKLARAPDSGADALILDLEDAVAAEDKPRARELVTEFLGRPIAPACFVRVNALSTGGTEADVAATVAGKPEGYVLPKCEGPDDVEALSRIIERHGGGEAANIMAIATETVRGIRRLMREDWSHPRLTALAWGGEDLAADMGAIENRDEVGDYLGPFRMARDLTLYAALEADAAPIDAVFTAFRNPDGLEAEARLASRLGFRGKLAVHPAQIAPINTAFTPTEAQVRWAREVVEAFRTTSGGVAWREGEMLDAPHLKRARSILSLVDQA